MFRKFKKFKKVRNRVKPQSNINYNIKDTAKKVLSDDFKIQKESV